MKKVAEAAGGMPSPSMEEEGIRKAAPHVEANNASPSRRKAWPSWDARGLTGERASAA